VSAIKIHTLANFRLYILSECFRMTVVCDFHIQYVETQSVYSYEESSILLYLCPLLLHSSTALSLHVILGLPGGCLTSKFLWLSKESYCFTYITHAHTNALYFDFLLLCCCYFHILSLIVLWFITNI
jgi:hypothetical protein